MRVIARKSGILWGVQGLLAALFLFAGGMKLVMPIVVPFVVGLLAATVAYGRWQPASRPASRARVFQPAH
jgi:hypothetical protein